MGEVTKLRAGAQITSPAPVSSEHDFSHFSCGKEPLDDWLHQRAIASEGKSARTYVVCQSNVVIGYYCLATGSERRVNFPKKVRQGIPDPTPLMIIGRLAVDQKYHGRRIGEGLLKDALLRVIAASKIVGSRAILVHAIDRAAVTFYSRYGFMEFPLGSETMFLPTETIVAAL